MRVASTARVLDWDSAFWGWRVARLHSDGSDDDAADLLAADEWCAGNEVAVGFLHLPSAATDRVGVACRAGFEVRGVEVVLARAPEPSTPSESVRVATGADAGALVTMAGTDLRGRTRFYRDPDFPDARCDELYRRWMQVSLDGWADTVLASHCAGTITGGVTIHLPTPERPARIGLLVLAPGPPLRRVAAAGRLLQDAFGVLSEAGATDVELSTQADNHATIRLLEAHGCTVRSVGLQLHKWYRSGGARRRVARPSR